ncbi:MAG: hypothetical protein R2698_11930 [Microthrixaceae bacterium]
MHPERTGTPATSVAILTLATATSVGLATSTVGPPGGGPGRGFVAGAAASALAVLALPSFSLHRTSATMCLVGGLFATARGSSAVWEPAPRRSWRCGYSSP